MQWCALLLILLLLLLRLSAMLGCRGWQLQCARAAAHGLLRAKCPCLHHTYTQVILTFGMSDTTLLFLKEASRKREFQVWLFCLQVQGNPMHSNLHSPVSAHVHCCCINCPAVKVVVAEAAPRYDGHRMARMLADAKVQTTLIADSAVFAMMARANKARHGNALMPPVLHCVP
jgi:Initiation factor 2 subunit family